MGRKWSSSNAFTPCARTLALARSLFAIEQKHSEGLRPVIFGPCTLQANMGHPSREQGFVLCSTSAAPMNSTKLAAPT